MIRKILIAALLAATFGVITYGQFTDCSTGLLQAPTAEMQKDGTFMITNNVLNPHSLPTSGWDYTTFQYGIYVSFWGRIEIGYVCTIFNGSWSHKEDLPEYSKIMRNQDRHFLGRICLVREGDFGVEWLPALVIGVSDPVTGSDPNTRSSGDYINIRNVDGDNNGYFNRNYIVFSKHFYSSVGEFGAHLGYQFNNRIDYHINSPCVGVNWKPVWIQKNGIIDWLNIVVEYDSRTINCGLVASIWNNHLEAMVELQNLRWINFGLRYKLLLKRAN